MADDNSSSVHPRRYAAFCAHSCLANCFRPAEGSESRIRKEKQCYHKTSVTLCWTRIDFPATVKALWSNVQRTRRNFHLLDWWSKRTNIFILAFDIREQKQAHRQMKDAHSSIKKLNQSNKNNKTTCLQSKTETGRERDLHLPASVSVLWWGQHATSICNKNTWLQQIKHKHNNCCTNSIKHWW